MANWLDKYNDDIPNAQNGIEGTMGGLTDQGFNYNGAWGGTMQMGGSLPGSVGHMYARTISPAPSNGKYAKKTKASAQTGEAVSKGSDDEPQDDYIKLDPTKFSQTTTTGVSEAFDPTNSKWRGQSTEWLQKRIQNAELLVQAIKDAKSLPKSEWQEKYKGASFAAVGEGRAQPILPDFYNDYKKRDDAFIQDWSQARDQAKNELLMQSRWTANKEKAKKEALDFLGQYKNQNEFLSSIPTQASEKYGYTPGELENVSPWQFLSKDAVSKAYYAINANKGFPLPQDPTNEMTCINGVCTLESMIGVDFSPLKGKKGVYYDPKTKKVIPQYNPTWLEDNNYEKVGYRKLDPNEYPQPGDLAQYTDEGRVHHMELVLENLPHGLVVYNNYSQTNDNRPGEGKEVRGFRPGTWQPNEFEQTQYFRLTPEAQKKALSRNPEYLKKLENKKAFESSEDYKKFMEAQEYTKANQEKYNKFSQLNPQDWRNGGKTSAQNGINAKTNSKNIIESNEWLTNWYKNRKIPSEQIQSIYEQDKPTYLERLKNIPEVTYLDVIDNDPRFTGTYDSSTNELLMTPNAKDYVYPHELNHYANAFPSMMRGVNANVAKANLLPKEDVKGVYNEHYDYFSDPDEVHSRIQVLRKEAGFKPDEKVTPGSLGSFMNNYKGDNQQINDLLNISDFSKLLEMLNYMAANKSNKNSNVAQNGMEMKYYQEGLDWKPKNISRDGGLLNKFQNGTPDSGVPKTPYWKNKIYRGPSQFDECKGEGCSKQATQDVASLYNQDYTSLDPQDAWYKRAAVIKSGGEEIYNKSQGDLQSIYGNLRVGDFVSLDRPGSPHANDPSKMEGYTLADNEGTEHLGYVVGFDPNGIPLIKHGHEGNIYTKASSYVQPITDLSLPDLGLNYKVNSIYRAKPLLNNDKELNSSYYKEMLPQENLSFYNEDRITNDKQQFIDAYNKNSEKFQRETGLSPEEISAIGNIAYGIFGNESKFNESLYRPVKQLGAEALHALGLRDTPPSLGPTQLKYDQVTKNKDKSKTRKGKLMRALGVKKNDIDNIFKSTDYDAITSVTFANLAENYKKLTTDPEFQYNAENNTVLGNVPLGMALAKSWQNPSLKNVKESLQKGDSDYANAAYRNMSKLEGQVFPGKLPEVVITPEKKNGGWLNKYDDGGIIEDPMGQWAHPGEITRIPSNQITMEGVDYPVLGISDTGDTKMMQPGEDYTYDGESVTEYPMMQYGGKAPINLRDYNRNIDTTAKRDAINVVPQKTMTVEQAKQLKAKKDAQELARRKQAIAASNKVNEMSDFNLSNVNQYLQSPTGLIKAVTSTPLQFITSLVNKEKYTPENFAIATGAIGDKARLFPNDPNSTFDDYINPFVQTGNMASDLGRAPLDIKQGNYGSAALSVATPILTGVGEQYLSNAIAPYLPAKGEVINELKDLKRAAFPTKPTFINPSEQELLSTVRNVGILSKTGANDASVLEKILAKGSGLTDDEFENLVGSSRSELKGKIQALRETPKGAKKVGENQFEWDVNPNANQSSPPILDANGNPISTSGNFNLNRPARSEASRLIADARRQGRQLQNLYDQVVTQQGGRDLSPQQRNTLQTFVDDTNQLIRTDPENAPNFSDFLNRSVQDLYNFKLQPNKSFIRGLTNRINEARYLPQSYKQADSLLPTLYRNETNNPAAEIIKAYRTLERAPKGSTFKSARSLSTDSYPATLRMSEMGLDRGILDINYTGMDSLNPSGFSQAAGIPTDINLKEMNTLIDQLNKKLPKPIPYGYIEGNYMKVPQISVTRKKNGGWLNKYE